MCWGSDHRVSGGLVRPAPHSAADTISSRSLLGVGDIQKFASEIQLQAIKGRFKPPGEPADCISRDPGAGDWRNIRSAPFAIPSPSSRIRVTVRRTFAGTGTIMALRTASSVSFSVLGHRIRRPVKTLPSRVNHFT